MSKKGLGDAQYAGKVKTQTFKQFQLERLIKDGTVIPASKLAELKEQELQRSREFQAAAVDEERHSRTSTPPPKDMLENQALTRERFEEWKATPQDGFGNKGALSLQTLGPPIDLAETRRAFST